MITQQQFEKAKPIMARLQDAQNKLSKLELSLKNAKMSGSDRYIFLELMEFDGRFQCTNATSIKILELAIKDQKSIIEGIEHGLKYI